MAILDLFKATKSDGFKVPAGTTGQRSNESSTLRTNTDYNKLEFSANGTDYTGLGGASGASGDAIFYENSKRITASYNIGNVTFKTLASGLNTANVVTDATNTLANGQMVSLDEFTWTVPTGLALGTQYWVVGSGASSFGIAASLGGAAITFTGAAGTLQICIGELKNVNSTGPLTTLDGVVVKIPTGSRYVVH